MLATTEDDQDVEVQDMICIILAGGFGTRIRSIIGDRPKGLIEVQGAALVSRIFHQVEKIQSINTLVLVSNSRHYDQFCEWKETTIPKNGLDVSIINNGVSCSDNRLGAVGDLDFAIRSFKMSQAVLVLAADCYFDFPLIDICECYERDGGNWIAVNHEKDPSKLVDGAEVEINDYGIVKRMKEKPTAPCSNLGALPFYVFDTPTLALVGEFLSEGENPDSPGRFTEWLFKRRRLSAYVIDLQCFCEDLGTPETYMRIADPIAAKGK